MSRPSLKKDLKTLAHRGWWLGFALGIVCHFVPPDYQVACKAVTDACSKLMP